jgi:hypothetical protein
MGAGAMSASLQLPPSALSSASHAHQWLIPHAPSVEHLEHTPFSQRMLVALSTMFSSAGSDVGWQMQAIS